MLKEFAWGTFENTGNIDAYVFLRELEGTNAFKAQKNEQSLTEEEVATSK